MLRPFYVFASSRPWHRDQFSRFVSSGDLDAALVTTPLALRQLLCARSPRFVFFLHWNHRVPPEIFNAVECVCFHMTDLPFGRGGSPLQHLILAGMTSTRLTAFRMIGDMDAGPIYMKEALSLEGSAEQIYRRAGELSFRMIEVFIRNPPEPELQHGMPTEFVRRRPEDSRLPEVMDAPHLYDFIRMLDAEGYPKAFFEHGELRIELQAAELLGDCVRASVTIRPKSSEDKGEP